VSPETKSQQTCQKIIGSLPSHWYCILVIGEANGIKMTEKIMISFHVKIYI
jgi:hypothetical protein